MDILNDGEYVRIEGRPAVRFVRRYPQTAAQLWAAVTDPDQLRHWFPSPEVSYEPRVGGSIRLGGDPYAPEGFVGQVRVWEPPHRFGFDWDRDELLLTVTADGDSSILELVNLLADEGAAARNGAGWDVCLAALARALAGRSDKPDQSMEAFLPVLAGYRDRGLPDDGWLPEQP